MASGFQNMTKIPELRRRLLYTLALLAVYRVGVFVTTPGVNASVMSKIVSQSSGTFLGLFNMFSGGALEKMSIFALGIMPYISSSIIIQLLTVVIPQLEQLQKEFERIKGRGADVTPSPEAPPEAGAAVVSARDPSGRRRYASTS